MPPAPLISMHPIFSCKVDCWTYVFFFIFRIFWSFKGPFWRSWAVFGVLLDPRGAQGGSGPHFIYLFAIFEALWEPRQRQKEPQGAQRRPKSCPKCAPRAVKATLKAYFFENCETLFFGRPGNPPGHQKTMKITVLSFKFKVLLISKK